MAMEAYHVLIVDDSRADSLVASSVFNLFNIRVTEIGSAMEALDFLNMNHHSVDLIVTEYNMPEMTGYELLCKLQESPILMRIPVVIACTEIIPERMMECLVGGAREYIIKPLKLVDVPRILSYM